MGVIAPQGIAGIVINTTNNYALVQSVLSMNKIRINASLKNSGFFGTLTWRGENSRTMHLSDIPKYADKSWRHRSYRWQICNFPTREL